MCVEETRERATRPACLPESSHPLCQGIPFLPLIFSTLRVLTPLRLSVPSPPSLLRFPGLCSETNMSVAFPSPSDRPPPRSSSWVSGAGWWGTGWCQQGPRCGEATCPSCLEESGGVAQLLDSLSSLSRSFPVSMKRSGPCSTDYRTTGRSGRPWLMSMRPKSRPWGSRSSSRRTRRQPGKVWAAGTHLACPHMEACEGTEVRQELTLEERQAAHGAWAGVLGISPAEAAVPWNRACWRSVVKTQTGGSPCSSPGTLISSNKVTI